MNRDEFCRKLGCDEAEVEAHMELGMPWYGERSDPEFDESEVATWLVLNGKAQIDANKVARTATDAAARLGISRQTLHSWGKMEGFPGCPGYYPVDEISEWNAGRNRRVNQYATERDVEDKKQPKQELSIKERRDLLKLRREESEVIAVDRVRRMQKRLHGFVTSQIHRLPEAFEAKLPAGVLNEEIRQITRECFDEVVSNCDEILDELWERNGAEADDDRML